MEKLCLFCKHFYFDFGSPTLSDVTPGWDFSIGCNLEFWDKNSFWNEEGYRKCQLKAKTCPKFEQVNLGEVK